MFLSYHELKKLIYVGETALGVVFIVASIYQLQISAVAMNPISHVATALILLVVGIGCVFFGVETYLLREDPDIWR